MKLLDYVEGFNSKKNVSVSRVMALKKYYVSMHRVYMMGLYDKGYISDPTRLSRKEFYSNILDMNIRGMFDLTGNIVLTSRMARYALCLCEDEEAQEFLEILYNVLRYGEYAKDIDALYDACDFTHSARVSMKLGLRFRGARVVSGTAYGVSRAILACFQEDGKTTKECSLNDKLWGLAMQELEIPESEWISDGLFVSGLCHECEVEFMDLILEGKVPLSGKYADLLKNWLYGHKWKERQFTASGSGAYGNLFHERSSEVFNIISNTLDSVVAEGGVVIGVSGSTYWVEEDIKQYNIPMGCICIKSGDEDELMFEGSAVDGYTGEVYPLEYIQQEGIQCVGCPVELYVSPKKKGMFYDLEEVDVTSFSWFKLNIVSLDFEDPEWVDRSNPFVSGSLERQLYDIYLDSLGGKLVGHLSSIKGLDAAKEKVMRYIERHGGQ